MTDMEREINALEAKLHKVRKGIKDAQRAKENEEGFEISRVKRQIEIVEFSCGNCGNTFLTGEENSIFFIRRENLPNYCSDCGAKVKKGAFE